MAVILIYNLANLRNFHILLIFSKTNLIRKIQYTNLKKMPMLYAVALGKVIHIGQVLIVQRLFYGQRETRPTSK